MAWTRNSLPFGFHWGPCFAIIWYLSDLVPSHPRQKVQNRAVSPDWSWEQSWDGATSTVLQPQSDFRRSWTEKVAVFHFVARLSLIHYWRQSAWFSWHCWGKIQHFSNKIKHCFKVSAAKSIWPFFCETLWLFVRPEEMEIRAERNFFLLVCRKGCGETCSWLSKTNSQIVLAAYGFYLFIACTIQWCDFYFFSCQLENGTLPGSVYKKHQKRGEIGT